MRFGDLNMGREEEGASISIWAGRQAMRAVLSSCVAKVEECCQIRLALSQASNRMTWAS